MRADLPTGTVTFLFTDIEGSTRLLHTLGAQEYADALARHRQVLRAAFVASGGVEVDTQGDAFFVAFPTAPGAAEAAMMSVRGLGDGPVRVRIGLHTGTPLLTDEGYVGVDVHRAARIAACGHGGQVLVSSAAASLLDPAHLRDLGEHRLKDLSRKERIFQLGDQQFPRLKSLHQTNLPVPATPFMGRERELAELTSMLAAGQPRLVTLTGPGGTGKTRLALQAAAEAADAFPDGVFWVPLAAVRDPALFMATSAQALAASEPLAVHVGDKVMLLLLDNLEQLVAGAPDIAALLAACPHLKVLVTSREVLGVDAEQAFPVPPFGEEEGVRFFAARARAADPKFVGTSAVGELCSRLDNLPLALELAAARVRMMSVEQLVARLGNRLDLLRAGRGVDPRQSTLRATIEWSHDLLEPGEQALFAQLAVFVGGCTLEAAEEVCAADLDVLQSLVDKSLVRVRDDGRFWMLETIREYAAERLHQLPEEAELAGRHAQHFRDVTQGERFSMEALEASVDVFPKVQVEHGNLLAALDHLEQTGATRQLLEMTTALSSFWLTAGFFSEARTRLERAIDADPVATGVRAEALDRLAEVMATTGDLVGARRRAEEALELHRSAGDRGGMSDSLRLIAYCHAEEGDLAEARELYEQCVTLLESGPADRSLVWAGRSLAWIHWLLGDLDEAGRRYDATLAEARRQGNRAAEATLLGALALLATEQGRFDEAMRLSHAGLSIWRERHDPLGVGTRLGAAASLLAATGRFEEAAQAFVYGRVLLGRLGAEVPWVTQMNEKTEAVLREHLDDLDLAGLQESSSGVTVEEAVDWALETLS